MGKVKRYSVLRPLVPAMVSLRSALCALCSPLHSILCALHSAACSLGCNAIRVVAAWGDRSVLGAFTINVRIFDPQGIRGSEEGLEGGGRGLPVQGEASPKYPCLILQLSESHQEKEGGGRICPGYEGWQWGIQ